MISVRNGRLISLLSYFLTGFSPRTAFERVQQAQIQQFIKTTLSQLSGDVQRLLRA
jgi:hypothetical protein